MQSLVVKKYDVDKTYFWPSSWTWAKPGAEVLPMFGASLTRGEVAVLEMLVSPESISGQRCVSGPADSKFALYQEE